MTSNRKWRAVPEDKAQAWSNAFAACPSCVALSLPCPVCGEAGLRRYYGKPTDEPRLLHGIKYKGRGAVWEWCIRCRTYEHASCLVPEQWVRPPLTVPEYELTPRPTGLAEALEPVLLAGWKPE